MKRLLIILTIGLMLALPFSGQAALTPAQWDDITGALVSGEEEPVPEECRIPVRDRRMGAVKGLDARWLHVLLMSTDAEDITENFGRTDAMLLCSVNLENGDVRLSSLPDGAKVFLPELPEAVRLRYLNCFGGPRLVVQALNQALQLNIGWYCAVNFDSFVALVDEIGGVRMTLSESEGQALNLPSGENRLDGEAALRFVRLRRQGDGMQRARRLLEAIARQALSQSSVEEALALVDLISPMLDTNLTMGCLEDLIFALLGQDTPGDMKSLGLLADENGKLTEKQARVLKEFIYGPEEKR